MYWPALVDQLIARGRDGRRRASPVYGRRLPGERRQQQSQARVTRLRPHDLLRAGARAPDLLRYEHGGSQADRQFPQRGRPRTPTLARRQEADGATPTENRDGGPEEVGVADQHRVSRADVCQPQTHQERIDDDVFRETAAASASEIRGAGLPRDGSRRERRQILSQDGQGRLRSCGVGGFESLLEFVGLEGSFDGRDTQPGGDFLTPRSEARTAKVMSSPYPSAPSRCCSPRMTGTGCVARVSASRVRDIRSRCELERRYSPGGF